MAVELEKIRATAQRVAASHGLDVADLEFFGGAKHRSLRVFIEKNAEEREKHAARTTPDEPVSDETGEEAFDSDAAANMDQLAGVTHEDCEAFSRDFGTVLDVEELIPGDGEYTLEVSSPGLDRKLHGRADFERFRGNLVKLQTFEAVAGNRHWQGRLTEVGERSIRLDLTALKQKQKGPKGKTGEKKPVAASEMVEIGLSNIEKANLIPEI
ncbi:ribosome maturation factor RimP [Paracidobacterium acidisoli]|uniref:Ribosome maturation factor RimP n=1 Tax=Paracidobacterium acidisoli TaxID=2303751 RepID=A0A372INU1_9BACT|nr:ribosome maturation factor RimP [Paracidobacterium acidisoli]MBT9330907.1 ribosome maturation factor RimP [Paracidobacterium acidisoli]